MTEMGAHHKPQQLDLRILHKRVHAAMRAWQKVTKASGDMLQDLLLYQDAAEADDQKVDPKTPRVITNYILSEALKTLAQQNASYAQLLQLRFVEGNSLGQTSDLMAWTIDQIRHKQRLAMEDLTTIIAHEEGARRDIRAYEIESQLPPSTYAKLFGCDDAIKVLVEQLLAKDASFIMAITGIGGIGKTAIADRVVREVISHFRFKKYVWIRVDPLLLDRNTLDFDTAVDLFANEIALKIAPEVAGNASKKMRMSRIRQVLKADPYLIVIDNLETISNTAFLMKQLQEWANPSKFLLTTRIRPMGEASVFSRAMEGLSEDDSAELLRHHALTIGQSDLAFATKQQAKLIFDVVGGNPLAIKLVVSLAKTMPITLVLDDLMQGYTKQVESLYDRIYRRIWQSLTHVQRNLLRAMPLVAESGGSVEQLRALSSLEDAELWPAINELVNRSLLELLGTTWERSYGVHRLTASFLQTNINRWEEDDTDGSEVLQL